MVGGGVADEDHDEAKKKAWGEAIMPERIRYLAIKEEEERTWGKEKKERNWEKKKKKGRKKICGKAK